jgi:hypothetical protein
MTFVMLRTVHLTNPYTTGNDIRQLQELLTSKGFDCIADGIFGPQTANECVKAKIALGYPKAQILPIAGELLVEKLNDYKPPAPLGTPVRDLYVEMLNYTLAHPSNWRYQEVRPIPYWLPYKTSETIITDCSGSVSLHAKWAKAPDPNGLSFNGEGYTGTILEHCQHITSYMLKPGDLVVFGSYPGTHCVAYLGSGEVFSHGEPGDPRRYTLAEMLSYFSGYTDTYMRFIYT